jgi:DNA-binding response OmpR family regulator
MKKQLLIIETDAELCSSLKCLLEDEIAQFRVATAPDSFKALGRLLQQPYNLVLLDQNVVGTDWIELALTIRAIWPDSRILLLGESEALSWEGKVARIFDGFIRKPFTPDQLLNAVERLLGAQSLGMAA